MPRYENYSEFGGGHAEDGRGGWEGIDDSERWAELSDAYPGGRDMEQANFNVRRVLEMDRAIRDDRVDVGWSEVDPASFAEPTSRPDSELIAGVAVAEIVEEMIAAAQANDDEDQVSKEATKKFLGLEKEARVLREAIRDRQSDIPEYLHEKGSSISDDDLGFALVSAAQRYRAAHLQARKGSGWAEAHNDRVRANHLAVGEEWWLW